MSFITSAPAMSSSSGTRDNDDGDELFSNSTYKLHHFHHHSESNGSEGNHDVDECAPTLLLPTTIAGNTPSRDVLVPNIGHGEEVVFQKIRDEVECDDEGFMDHDEQRTRLEGSIEEVVVYDAKRPRESVESVEQEQGQRRQERVEGDEGCGALREAYSVEPPRKRMKRTITCLPRDPMVIFEDCSLGAITACASVSSVRDVQDDRTVSCDIPSPTLFVRCESKVFTNPLPAILSSPQLIEEEEEQHIDNHHHSASSVDITTAPTTEEEEETAAAPLLPQSQNPTSVRQYSGLAQSQNLVRSAELKQHATQAYRTPLFKLGSKGHKPSGIRVEFTSEAVALCSVIHLEKKDSATGGWSHAYDCECESSKKLRWVFRPSSSLSLNVHLPVLRVVLTYTDKIANSKTTIILFYCGYHNGGVSPVTRSQQYDDMLLRKMKEPSSAVRNKPLDELTQADLHLLLN